MKASTAIILVVTLFAMLIAGGGGALLVASQKDRDADTALPATPVNVNNTLSREYPVETDPLVANRNCAVQNAVYKDAGPCVGEDGTVLDGTVGRCGSGTVTRKLDTEESAGFVPESGTGTCDILETTGECQVPCPVDCSGGAWIDGQSCLRTNSDGSTATLVDGGSPEDGTCGQGQMTRTRDTNTDDFVGAIGLGSCTLETSAPCSRTCANGEVIGECGYNGIKAKDRDIGSAVLGHEGCVKKDASNKPVKDEDGNYVPVEVGGTGLERWYEAAVYGDTAKCEDLVQWKTCQGPPTPIDCVGGWLDQDPNTAGAQEWSACKLPEGEVCGATYREKQYHITTPQGTRTVGGVSISNGEVCSATVTVDGQDESRTMEEGGQLTFTEWCGESKKVACCEKSNWVLDENRGLMGCALDDNGENPTKRYTRTVTGACDPDDDPHGNALEKFVECCFEGGWSVPEGAKCNTAGKIKEIQTVIGDACTNNQRDSANKVRYEKDCCYESGWSVVPNSCRADGKLKEVQTVVGLDCDPDQMKLSNKERYEIDCCYESGWSVVPNSCRSDGKMKEVQTVAGSDEVCEDWQKGYDNKVRYEKDCCYKSGWFEPDGAPCNTSGKKLEKQIVKGAECTPDELGDTERYKKDCCYNSGWSVPPGQKCSLINGEGKMKEVRTLTGMKCDGGATVQYKKDCCYMGEWEDVGECNVQGKQKREREVVGTGEVCSGVEDTRWIDCCYEGDNWSNEGECVARGQKQTQTVVGTEAACIGVEDTRWIDCCDDSDPWQNEGACTDSGQKQTREVKGSTCNDTDNPTVQWIGCCDDSDPWQDVGACTASGQRQTREVLGDICSDDSEERHLNCCVEGSWVNWGACDKTTGKQKQWRENVGNNCGGVSTTRDADCKVDCEGYHTNPTCPTACGTAASTPTKTWVTTVEAKNGGTACPGNSTKSCPKTEDCAANCDYTGSNYPFASGFIAAKGAPSSGWNSRAFPGVYVIEPAKNDKASMTRHLDECAKVCNETSGCKGFKMWGIFGRKGIMYCWMYNNSSAAREACWDDSVKQYWRKKSEPDIGAGNCTKKMNLPNNIYQFNEC